MSRFFHGKEYIEGSLLQLVPPILTVGGFGLGALAAAAGQIPLAALTTASGIGGLLSWRKIHDKAQTLVQTGERNIVHNHKP